MKILFDQNVPVNIREYLSEDKVRTAAEMDWDRLENGTLLRAAEDSGFDIFLTADQNITYQQNLSGRKIALSCSLAITGRKSNSESKKSRPQFADALQGLLS